MTPRVHPYLHFHGNTREAMEFYTSVFDGSLSINTYADMNPDSATEDAALVVHASLTGTAGLILMASDIPPRDPYTVGNAFSVSIGGEDEAELTEYWDQLSADGSIVTPFTKSSWGSMFGSCVDRFGVTWLVNVMPPRRPRSA
jgi:PhnB protein